ncbi:hypothetical protein BBO99_00003334 [Phytophthora kernoviae]|uniref:Mini-chromosome maintenance complex-binding protein n=2 Tax=Phytophthora kernoviae TaxID=325452 RepID=A0A3R7GNF6_9STRA|nr:hypothetical protein G195_003649 [Phytophthora kernoviae 00238/432]KAG2528231.1 hypothetical protein JM16_002961 [Phytophthora kernoviae]KAG2529856.1 hypothetical protein JM18_002648 [Phytophthora kernoviae]RLN21457.1 hypothetical protein BBI17_003392 [Phytophthora kernoviae]RLN81876.1 hypothetical protein BBO99_00003334 [Phytophthora kernoviae]
MLDLSAQLSASRDVSSVPILNESSFRLGKYRDGSVLKFRGVVRDVQDPELVLLSGADAAQQLVERLPLTVTLFPHASDWATQAYRNVSVVDSATGTMEPTEETKQEQKDGCSVGTGTKRSNEVVEPSREETKQEQKDSHAKKPKSMEKQSGSDQTDRLLLPDAVNIFVYDGQYKDMPLDAFKVNEAFEFVGILDLMVAGSGLKKTDTELSAKEIEELQISDCIEEVQHKERSGLVLHCCYVSQLENLHHVRPHEPSEFYMQIQESNETRTKFCQDEWVKLGQEKEVATMRKQIIDYLAQTMRGDILAAEYLLLNLLSHVYSRADPSTPLGNLSLNLALEKSSSAEEKGAFVAQLHKTVASLMPMVAQVDLSLSDLNSAKFMPYKDYEREVLLSGVLQMANGTIMLVNETTLTAGQLNEQGVKNIAALQSLIEKMLLPYDFHFYNMDFPQDVAVVTVSEGKSILPVNVAVPLVTTDDADSKELSAVMPGEQLLECFRVFLSVLRLLTVTIGNEEADMAEKHYVECRKSQQKVALEDLHRWLRLARLMALSRGEGEISKASWDAMLALETQRLARSTSNESTST